LEYRLSETPWEGELGKLAGAVGLVRVDETNGSWDKPPKKRRACLSETSENPPEEAGKKVSILRCRVI
jgi:hypothetical protein